MTEEIQKWLDALRSENYVQASHYLKKDKNEYCCMGVLCEIYRKETGDGKWEPSDYSNEIFTFKTDDTVDSQVPPDKVWEWAGINPKRFVNGTEIRQILGDKNDNLEWPFYVIADYIEENLDKGYFIKTD